MSLFTFTASATHTATTNVTKNNAVIIFFLSLTLIVILLLSFDAAKVRLFAHTDKESGQKDLKNGYFIDTCQL